MSNIYSIQNKNVVNSLNASKELSDVKLKG